ncbi:Prp 4 [Dactylonectria macrodidyma]|uniref:Prp 4 n=1 Tax=Dactylonectria macrodidyma TaxID=307937 RepID=A0A9P9IDA4_9HYPO|nr:Prp 4 [Dactylonectria macrodidyma]
MKLFSTLVRVGLASTSVAQMAGQSAVFLVGRGLGGLEERQGECGEGTTCETACGPEWRTCAMEPWCYNPNIHVCCSGGFSCDKGWYCATTESGPGCCKNGISLEQCGATATLPTVPLPVSTQGPSTSTISPQAPKSSATVTTSLASVITTSLASVVTAGAGKNTEVGASAAIGGVAALLLAA